MTRLFVILFLSLLFTLPGLCQNSEAGEVVPEPEDVFLDAEYFFDIAYYDEAVYNYYILIDSGFGENAYVRYKTGISELKIDNATDAIKWLEKAAPFASGGMIIASLGGQKCPFDVYLYLGDAYRISRQFAKAEEAYKKFLSLRGSKIEPNTNTLVNKQIEACQLAQKSPKPNISTLEKVTVPFKPSETVKRMQISADNKTMVYLAQHPFYDALHFSRKTNGSWSIPENITQMLGSDGDQIPLSLSTNGDTLLLLHYEEGLIVLYASFYKKGKWTKSKMIDKQFRTEKGTFSACITPNGKEIIYSMQRSDALGGMDLYLSRKIDNETWGKPENLGNLVNTPLNEDFPIISANGTRLFFCSQGNDNYGGYDIFYADLMPDKTWGKPVNAGINVNTPADDIRYSVSGNGEYLYIFANENINYPEKGVFIVKLPSLENK